MQLILQFGAMLSAKVFLPIKLIICKLTYKYAISEYFSKSLKDYLWSLCIWSDIIAAVPMWLFF